MGLKGQTEFRQPKIKQKRIPDKSMAVSVSQAQRGESPD